MPKSLAQQIRDARTAKGWSLERLAKELSQAMGLKKPLSWQAVQQWEKATGTAPSRKKMPHVLKLLDIKAEGYAANAAGLPTSDDLAELMELWPHITAESRKSILGAAREAAIPALAKNHATYQRIMARSADEKRVEAKLGLPQKLK
jgi:transcriptional regulator with XRE-family HTH domain